MVSEFNKRLNDLDDLVEEAWTLPLAKDKYVVDGDKLKGIIFGIKENLPAELKKANELLDGKEKFVAKAKEEATIVTDRAKKNAEMILAKAKSSAEATLENARREAEHLIEEEEVMLIANDRAEKIIARAKSDAVKMRNVTIEYVDNIISQAIRTISDAARITHQANVAAADDMRHSLESLSQAAKTTDTAAQEALLQAVSALREARAAYAENNDDEPRE